MQRSPVFTQLVDERGQFFEELSDLLRAQFIDLSQLWRTVRAMQFEDGFTALSNDMDMSGAVVVGPDDDSVAIEAMNRGHFIGNPTGWVSCL
jgi:hypothetical protein